MNGTESLSHTAWEYKHHVVFNPVTGSRAGAQPARDEDHVPAALAAVALADAVDVELEVGSAEAVGEAGGRSVCRSRRRAGGG
jgi:hypothetical protein